MQSVLCAVLCLAVLVMADDEVTGYNALPGACVREFDPVEGVPSSFLGDALDAVRESVEAHFKDGGATGLAYRVVYGDQVLLEDALGVMDHETERPINMQTRFKVMSITKAVTAATALVLRDRGMVRLDVPAAEYVPELKSVPNRKAPGSYPQFTLGDLATYCAGLPGSAPCNDDSDDPGVTCNTTYTEIIQRWARAGGPAYAPMQKPEYSNFGIALLGYALAASQGAAPGDARQLYTDVVRSLVFDPLGMANSGFDLRLKNQTDLMARAYTDAGKLVPLEMSTFMLPSHGMYASVEDLSRFMASFFRMDAPAVDPASGTIMRGTSVREAIRGTQRYQSSGGADVYVGYGWNVMTAPTNNPEWGIQVQKFGQKRDEYAAYIGFIPGLKIGITMALTHGPPTGSSPIFIEMCESLLGDILAPALFEELQGLMPLPLPPPPSFDQDTFLGTYKAFLPDLPFGIGPITVERAHTGGGLLIKLPSWFPKPSGWGDGPYMASYGTLYEDEQSIRYSFDVIVGEDECSESMSPIDRLVLVQQGNCVGFLLPESASEITGVKSGCSSDCASVITL